MKTKLFFLVIMMSLASVYANYTKESTNKIGVTNRYNDAVSFVERHVKFHVFLNGDFDFNTNNYYRRGIRIERDYYGKIRRIGNVFINYNYHGKVTRIGNVFIEYRYGNITKIGNMFINYDRLGRPYFNGYVKNRHVSNTYYGPSCEITNSYEYDNSYFYRDDFRNNYTQFREDTDFYYYRAKPKSRLGNPNRIIKRRKPVKNLKYHKSKRKIAIPEQTGRSRRS